MGARTVREGEGLDDSGRAGAGSLPGSLETTAAAVEADGRRALPITMDLLDRPSLEAAVGRVLAEWGRVDVLVNNAVHTGPGSMSRFDDTTVEMVETKLDAPAHSIPSTYLGKDGKQYVAVAAGGGGFLRSPLSDEVIAFRLP